MVYMAQENVCIKFYCYRTMRMARAVTMTVVVVKTTLELDALVLSAKLCLHTVAIIHFYLVLY